MGEDERLSKHRRPSRLARVRQIGHSPLQLSIAAGVAGTVAVTGTVVASAADHAEAHGSGNQRPAAPSSGQADTATQAVDAADALGGTDVAYSAEALTVRLAVDAERVARAERLAEAKARAIAKRKAEKRAALAEKRAERRAAQQQAEEARTFTAASRGVERMSASAANVLQAAAAVASGAYYTYGGAGPSGFDCSGFTAYVFAKVGVSLPHSSSAQRAMVQSISSPQPGDLVFVYNGGGGSIGHVGIYAGGGYWWEAANPSTGVGLHRAWSSAVSYGRVL